MNVHQIRGLHWAIVVAGRVHEVDDNRFVLNQIIVEAHWLVVLRLEQNVRKPV